MDFLKPGTMKFTILSSLYAGMLMLGPVLSNRIISIGGLNIMLGAVVVVMALGVLDIINNDYGIKRAKEVVLSALVIRFVLWCVIGILMMFPVVSESPGYAKIVHTSFQIVVAGELSMFFSQYFIDTKLFDMVKKRFSSFFVRYSVSNLMSFTLGTAIFLPIAFYGREGIDLWALFWGHLAARLLIQLVLSPVYSGFVYRGKGEVT